MRTAHRSHVSASSERARPPRRSNVLRACALVAVLSSLLITTDALRAAATTSRSTTRTVGAHLPVGIRDLREPSGYRPPSATAMRGYRQTYVDDFRGPLSWRRWFLFSGVPSGDPSGLFAKSHVGVSRGLLRISTWRDARYGGQWTSGGVGLYGVPFTYGAIFVRSRETAPGPDTTELLWPADNQWPPEIDFDEAGQSSRAQWWFVHYDSPGDQVDGHMAINIEHWHTYGVIWTPSSIRFVVDGKVWGKTTSSSVIPHLAMTLDLQAQSWCGIQGEPCPSRSSTLLVNWVALYTRR
jgi:Glycosyl hydrolases family 16